MRPCALGALLLAACSFDVSGLAAVDGAPAAVDAAPAPVDALPAEPGVRVVSIEADVDVLRPGDHGIEVVVVLRNDLPVVIADVALSLSFSDGAGAPSDDFRYRDADAREGLMTAPASELAAGSERTHRFVVDVLPWAAGAGAVTIDASATMTVSGTPAAATPLATPPALDVVAVNDILVDLAADEVDADTAGMSFREALAAAAARPGLDRIVFDASVFPADAETVVVLDEALGPLPAIVDDLIIDGHGAGFHLAVDSNWTEPEGRYGLRLDAGTLVIHGIGFRNMGYQYRDEGDLSVANCGASAAQLEGGAIRVDGGTLILDGNTFADPDVDERNCFAASVRLHGGAGHRIIGNRFTDPVMDHLYVAAPTVEIAHNVMDGGSTPERADECIYVNSQGGQDLWIVGNLCADQEYSGVVARGTDAGTLYLVNNTFVRNGRASLSAVRRDQGVRAVVLRNNVYVANDPAAVQPDGQGDGFDLAFEAVQDSPLCTDCSAATLDAASMIEANLMVVDAAGTTRADLAPRAGSPLVDSGVGWLDRNGAAPGRHHGAGPDRGAIELP